MKSPCFVICCLFLLLGIAQGSLVRGLAKEAKPKAKEDAPEEQEAKEAANKDDLELADSETAYTYQLLATAVMTAVDDIANDQNLTDPSAFYMERIVPTQTEDIVWVIDAGERHMTVNGTEGVEELWVSFASRKFSFHTPSHFEIFEDDTGVWASFRYHGVALEAEGDFQDIFGAIRMHFNDDDLIDYFFAQRFYTINRGYSAEVDVPVS